MAHLLLSPSGIPVSSASPIPCASAANTSPISFPDTRCRNSVLLPRQLL